jgi:hypothetical protein
MGPGKDICLIYGAMENQYRSSCSRGQQRASHSSRDFLGNRSDQDLVDDLTGTGI